MHMRCVHRLHSLHSLLRPSDKCVCGINLISEFGTPGLRVDYLTCSVGIVCPASASQGYGAVHFVRRFISATSPTICSFMTVVRSQTLNKGTLLGRCTIGYMLLPGRWHRVFGLVATEPWRSGMKLACPLEYEHLLVFSLIEQRNIQCV